MYAPSRNIAVVTPEIWAVKYLWFFLDVLAGRVADAFQDCVDDHETILAQGDS
jgi:hypothetical protein